MRKVLTKDGWTLCPRFLRENCAASVVAVDLPSDANCEAFDRIFAGKLAVVNTSSVFQSEHPSQISDVQASVDTSFLEETIKRHLLEPLAVFVPREKFVFFKSDDNQFCIYAGTPQCIKSVLGSDLDTAQTLLDGHVKQMNETGRENFADIKRNYFFAPN